MKNPVITVAAMVFLVVITPSYAGEGATVSLDKGGLTIVDGDNKFQIGGRIQADAAWFSQDKTSFDDGTDVRRARLVVKGVIERVWKYKFQYDFASTVVKDLYVQYRGFGFGNITFGQHTPPVSLENMMSSKWITFIERPMVANALVPDRELGVGFDTTFSDFSFAASVTGDNLAADDTGSDSPSVLSRLVWAPRREAGNVLHVGASSGYIKTDRSETVSIGARPEARVDSTPKLIEVTLTGVDARWLGGVEFAWARGPLSLQAEYLGTKLDGAGDPLLDGYYASVSWFPGDDMRSYDFGYAVFDRPVNARRSWELGARYSSFDLTESAGGRENNTTLSLTYYANPNVRFSANVIHAEVEDGVSGDESLQAGVIRGQLAF